MARASVPDLTLVPDVRGDPTPALLPAAALLAEPPAGSGQWPAACFRRILACQARPVAVGLPQGPVLDRLRAAGIPCLPEGNSGDLDTVRQDAWPVQRDLDRLGIAHGSPRPALLVVAERATRPDQVTLAARSGTWLLAALRLLGYDELRLLLVNAYDHLGRGRPEQLDGVLRAVAPYDPKILVLGVRAAKAVRKLGWVGEVRADHPMAWRRFRYALGAAGYAAHLRQAGLPDAGPELDAAPFAVRDRELPVLPAPYDLATVGYVPGISAPRGDGRHRTKDDPKLARARELFVTGVCRTLAEAARQSGTHESHVQRAARAEDWVAERDQESRRRVEEAKAERRRSFARSVATSTQLATVATERALASVLKRMAPGADGAAPALEPTPQEAEALARIAARFLELDAPDVEALDQMAGKTLGDLLAIAQRSQRRLLGHQDPEPEETTP